MPQDLPNLHYISVAEAALNTQAQVNMGQSDLINNRMVKFVVFYRIVSTILASAQTPNKYQHVAQSL